MKQRVLSPMLWVLGWALLALGVGLTLRTARQIPLASERIERRLANLETVAQTAEEAHRAGAAMQLFAGLSNAVPSSPAALLKDILPDAKAEELRESRTPCAPGWVLKEKELGLGEVSLVKAMEFIQRAEKQPPPWRLTKLAIRGVERTGGLGQVVVQMEVLERVGRDQAP